MLSSRATPSRSATCELPPYEGSGVAGDRLDPGRHAEVTNDWNVNRSQMPPLGGRDNGVMSQAQGSQAHRHLPLALRRRLGLVEDSAEAFAGHVHELVPAWLRSTRPENRLPVMMAVLVAVALQLTLPRRLSLHPRELLPALELLLLVALSAVNPVRLETEHRLLRAASAALVALITLANAASAFLMAQRLVEGTAGADPVALLLAGGGIYLTNIIAFGLWYWEFDRGGPFARRRGDRPHGDFLFAQMATPEVANHDWEPRFVDYLYVSFTNATAFSPTDTLPLSRWAKLLMATQSLVSLVTVALVIARAVNILK